MLVSNMLNRLQAVKRVVVCSRNLGSVSPAMQKATDPIQQLFVDKIREYKQKSPYVIWLPLINAIIINWSYKVLHIIFANINSLYFCFRGGKFVDPTPQIELELKSELEKLAKIYGGDGKTDMTQFPTFKFDQPKLDPINQESM